MNRNKLEGKELENLILQTQRGNQHESGTALATIVEAYQGLITKVVHSQYKNLAMSYNSASNSLLAIEDLMAIAQLAFVSAVKTFSLPNSFISYCSMKIKFALSQFVKEFQGPCYLPEHIYRKRKQEANAHWSSSTRRAVNAIYSSEELHSQLRSADDIDLWELYQLELLNLIEKVFSPRVRQIFSLKIQGYSGKEISSLTGLSPRQVSKEFRMVIGETKNLEELENRLLELRTTPPQGGGT